MTDSPPLPIDHVELVVSDRRDAAAWYGRVLGLATMPDYEAWAHDPKGPLMLSGDGGGTKIALFQRQAAAPASTCRTHRVAFRLDASGLFAAVERLARLGITNGAGRPFGPESIVDHDQAYSVYFSDPDGNLLELTTYEYERVSEELRRRGGGDP